MSECGTDRKMGAEKCSARVSSIARRLTTECLLIHLSRTHCNPNPGGGWVDGIWLKIAWWSGLLAPEAADDTKAQNCSRVSDEPNVYRKRQTIIEARVLVRIHFIIRVYERISGHRDMPSLYRMVSA